jgi:hypothetical protein
MSVSSRATQYTVENDAGGSIAVAVVSGSNPGSVAFHEAETGRLLLACQIWSAISGLGRLLAVTLGGHLRGS